MRKSQLEKLDALLLEIGYSSRRRKTGITYIKGFFEQVKKSPKDVMEGDIRGYIATTKNCHLKFWLRFFYSDLIIHFQNLKFTRLQKRLKIMGFDDICFRHIQNLCQYSHKSMSRITTEDVNGYIRFNHIMGDELLKIESISKMFSDGESKKKIIIISKNKEALRYEEVLEKLDNSPDIKGLIERAQKLDKHYCIKMNSMVARSNLKFNWNFANA